MKRDKSSQVCILGTATAASRCFWLAVVTRWVLNGHIGCGARRGSKYRENGPGGV